MNDVIYAGFSQLSYLHWHNYQGEIGDKLIDIIRNKEYLKQIERGDYDEIYGKGKSNFIIDNKVQYDGYDQRIFVLYSENEDNPDDNPKFLEFQDWEFLCAYNHKKIYEENKYIITKNDSGFQASAFKKGNKVMIAYRGTDELVDWTSTNAPLGFNQYVDQLFCTAWFYDKVLEELGSEVSSAEIHITGHSMGGALAQFAFVYSGCKHKTVTWNGLGIGDAEKGFSIHSGEYNLNAILFYDLLEEFGYLDGKKWLSKCLKPNGDEIIDKYREQFKNFLGDQHNHYKNIKDKEVESLRNEIEFKLKVMYKYQSNFNKHVMEKEKFEIESVRYLKIGILESTLDELDYLSDGVWLEKCKNSNGEEIAKKYNENYKIQYGSYTEYRNNIQNNEIDSFKKEIEEKLKKMYDNQGDIENEAKNPLIENIYVLEDLTPNLKRRFGIIKVGNKENSTLKIDTGSVSPWRIVFNGLSCIVGVRSPGSFHSIPNFLPFMDDEENVVSGKLRERYIRNSIKTLVTDNEKNGEDGEIMINATKKMLETGKLGLEYPVIVDSKIKEMCKIRNVGDYSNGGRDISAVEKISLMLFQDNLKEEIEQYKCNWYTIEDNKAVVGQFTNYTEIGGVKGGVPLRVNLKSKKFAGILISDSFMELGGNIV